MRPRCHLLMWFACDLAENSGYELDIVATTRSNGVRQSFSFVSFSLSTEFLEDKQGFKLGGVDTSPSYLLFRTLLPLFWTLICMI